MVKTVGANCPELYRGPGLGASAPCPAQKLQITGIVSDFQECSCPQDSRKVTALRATPLRLFTKPP